MFFYVEYTDENVMNYKKNWWFRRGWNLLQSWWNQPILVSKQRVTGDSMSYRKYLECIDSSLEQSQGKERQKIELRKLKNNKSKYNENNVCL